MYLSAFNLDIKSPSVRQCLANAQDMHRNILSAFGNQVEKTQGSRMGVLYRLIESGKLIKLYVLSPVLPDWCAVRDNGFHLRGQPKNIEFLYSQAKKGRLYGFDILCIPSKKEVRQGKNSRRVMLRTQEERMEWFIKKAEQNGFSIVWAREEARCKVITKNVSSGISAWHSGVRFRGNLMVSDVTLFSNAFIKGIGAGKAYGFGLLLLLPPQG
jgi:CRISPR system Cascade subunit CasE